MLDRLHQFGIDDYQHMNDNILIVKKWSWNYLEALEFQQQSLSYIKENKNKVIYIFCNHPHCFTMGRGLQKGKEKEFSQLQDFDFEQAAKLKYPIYKIKRGGGLTFHYPGQLIIYPIVNLNNPNFCLKDLTYWLLDTIKEILEKNYNLQQLETRRAFLGLWRNQDKLASVGIGVERFVTYHGMAINVYHDQEIMRELLKVNPCGLSANTYKALEQVIDKKHWDEDMIDKLYRHFIQRMVI